MDKERFINILLIVGVTLGLSLALFSSIRDTSFDTNVDWVATIEDSQISKDKYLLQIEGLSLDKRSPLTEEDKAFVLERMIEEELLILRAKDLGMFSSNTMIRGAVVQQMINMIISENSLSIISDDELKKFYNSNKGFFTNADRLRIKQIFFSDIEGDALRRAQSSYMELLEGSSLEDIMVNSDKTALEIPDTLMTLAKIREYIGPSLMQVAKMLQPGEFSSPKKVQSGYKIIFLIQRKDASPPPFELIKDRVRSEYKKREDDQALRDYLNQLKKWYEIERNLDF